MHPTPEIDLNAVATPLHLPEIFGRHAPVHVEIGAGKGRFLLELASSRPELDFLAVERAAKYHSLVCTRIARRGISNVRTIRTTGEDLLFRLLPEASVHSLYVLFPDPWPKKRHHKRRLFNTTVSAAMVRVLKPGGPLLVKSDHPAYSEVIGEVLRRTSGLDEADPEHAFAGLPHTGFECKYLVEGREIKSFAMTRNDSLRENNLDRPPQDDLVPETSF